MRLCQSTSMLRKLPHNPHSELKINYQETTRILKSLAGRKRQLLEIFNVLFLGNGLQNGLFGKWSTKIYENHNRQVGKTT